MNVCSANRERVSTIRNILERVHTYGVVVSHAMIQWLVATASAMVLMATAPKNSDILVIVCVEHRMMLLMYEHDL